MYQKQETVQVFRERPLGLRLGNRNGINYVYAIDKPRPEPSKPTPQQQDRHQYKNDTYSRNTAKLTKIGKTSTMAEIQYSKLEGLLGKRVVRIQEIDVQLYTLQQLSDLINSEKLPMYVTFGEDIGIFEDLEEKKFDPDLHLSYFKAMLTKPPSQYVAMDVQRMTLLFFSIFAIDLLCDMKVYYNSSEELKSEKQDIIEWIYAQQVISNATKGINYGGFRGGSFLGVPFNNNNKPEKDRLVLPKWDRVNMASTHNAICILIGLGMIQLSIKIHFHFYFVL